MKPDFVYTKEIMLGIIMLGVIILFILSIRLGCQDVKKEGWVNYRNWPYGQASTAFSDPIGLYICPEYRLPYNWPLGVKRSYPVPHVAPLKMGVV
jgi:hypothetical protein